MTDRYTVRPDAVGFTILDAQTAEPVTIGMAPQRGLSKEDADHTAQLLNERERPPAQTRPPADLDVGATE